MRDRVGRAGTRRLLVALGITALALTLAVPAASGAPKTKLVSQSSTGNQTGHASDYPDIGARGNGIVFETSGNLLGTDYNLHRDIYRRTISSKRTDYVSRAKNGDLANGHSVWPVLSANGRYVVFVSYASNLTAADAKGHAQVYRRDLVAGKTKLASKGADGAAEDLTRNPDVSATGRYVVFASRADNLTTKNTHGRQQVYLRDMKSKKTFLISQNGKGKASDQDCSRPTVSDDGRFVAFISLGTNLSSKDERGQRQVFLRDRKLGKTALVSQHPKKGKAGDAWSYDVVISGNGRYVVLATEAANLINWGKDSNGQTDIYKYDRLLKTVRRVSVDSRGRQLHGASKHPNISADGRVVVFATAAPNVVPGVATGDTQVYRRGLKPSGTKLVSRTNGGVPANGDSSYPSVSGDGRFVAYQSEATNLTRRTDANGSTQDIFRTGPF